MTDREITLTPRERAVLVAIRDSDYHDGRDPVGDPVWSSCLRADGVETRSLPGVVASLSKKGLVQCDGKGRDDSTVALTAAGEELAR